MPLKKGSSQKIIGYNISEFHKGQTYASTARKFGKNKADKQAVAVAMNQARKSKSPAKAFVRKRKY
jgi:hypothetical protein